MTGWAAFWLFMLVFFLADTFVFLQGFDSVFYKHDTPAERELHERRMKARAEADHE